jgi:hypothetical protein
VLGALFADGNIPYGFTEFQRDHRCNVFCRYFELSPPSVDSEMVDGEATDAEDVEELAKQLSKTGSIALS